MPDLDRPRTPLAPLDRGMYESHYLTAVDPSGGRALWLRHTTLKRPGALGCPTTWMVWSDVSAGAPRCLRVTDDKSLNAPAGVLGASAHGTLSASGAAGALEGVAWDLGWQPHAPELPYLPARWLYDRPLPRSNGVALIPAATMSGTVTLDDAPPISLQGWDGMIGHNWGTEHPEQWSWLHAGGLGEDRSGWLDLVLVRVRVGPLLTPWIAAGAVLLGGRRYVPARTGRVHRDLDGDHARVRLRLSDGARMELAITSPPARTAHWDYASPAGPGRVVDNCSVADASIILHTREGRQKLMLGGRFAAEHGAIDQATVISSER